MIPWVYFRSLHNYIQKGAVHPRELWTNFGIHFDATPFLVNTDFVDLERAVTPPYLPGIMQRGVQVHEHSFEEIELHIQGNDPQLHPPLPSSRPNRRREAIYEMMSLHMPKGYSMPRLRDPSEAHRFKWTSSYNLNVTLHSVDGTIPQRARAMANVVLDFAMLLGTKKLNFCMPHNPHTAKGNFSRMLFYDNWHSTYSHADGFMIYGRPPDELSNMASRIDETFTPTAPPVTQIEASTEFDDFIARHTKRKR